MADEGHRLREQRPVVGDQAGALERSLPGQRPDAQDALAAAQIGERVDPVEVDEPARPREPEVEQRHQALAARERARVIAEQRERLVEGVGGDVLERRGLHRRPSRSARHSFSAV
jgi:hypothetical protein